MRAPLFVVPGPGLCFPQRFELGGRCQPERSIRPRMPRQRNQIAWLPRREIEVILSEQMDARRVGRVWLHHKRRGCRRSNAKPLAIDLNRATTSQRQRYRAGGGWCDHDWGRRAAIYSEYYPVLLDTQGMLLAVRGHNRDPKLPRAIIRMRHRSRSL